MIEKVMIILFITYRCNTYYLIFRFDKSTTGDRGISSDNFPE